MIVFVYGTLKKDYWNNYLLGGSLYLGRGTTQEDYMIYYESYPFAVHSSNIKNGLCLPIQGELYLVNKPTLDILDELETGYERKLRPINTSEGMIEAYMYEWPYASPYGITTTCKPVNNTYEWKEK